ncbi:ATP-binding protein [Corynebacterium comes]|uniref:Chromosome partition protein Smc n=1 Tax=Corynebacterium comes TaxID=2675218 RepID=A0A6B8VH03_9CORY|nr:ATP-binding protein [Corynebacterium comes]QGU03453.1 Chromosome partition protein Smc [Corynebacterium comes]
MSIHPGQYRLSRIQLINWGTFEGSVDIPVAREGFLVTGGSGSGKSTLIDAVTAVLLPGDRVRFNAAAQANTPRGKGRNLVSYIRGAWRSREDHASGTVVATYLRPKATYSVVGLTYDDGDGGAHTLVAMFYLKSGHNSPAEVSRFYGLFPGDQTAYDLVEYLGSGIDKRRIKATHKKATFSENHSVFAGKFRQRLGIASEETQYLLHRAQSAKDLQSLDDLFRDYMLEEPGTFGFADTAVEQFRDLEGAYEKVEDIKSQVAALEPLVGLQHKKGEAQKAREHTTALKRALRTVGNRIKRDEQEVLVRRFTVEHDEASSRLESAAKRLTHVREMERFARDAVEDTLGAKHGELSARREAAADNAERTEAHRARLVDAVEGIGGQAPESAEDFLVLSNAARVITDEYPAARAELEAASQEAVAARTRAADEHEAADRELRALSRGTSNIDSRLLEVRERMCQDLGLNLRDVPFAGELIDPVDPEWEPVVQRLLGGLAATLLVESGILPRIREWIHAEHLGTRLVVSGVRTGDDHSSPRLAHNALPRKVNVIASPFQGWLQVELGRNHNILCVNGPAELAELGPRDAGVTIRGLRRFAQRTGDSTERLEKDDRRRLGDRSSYRLGSTNHDKIELLRQQVKQTDGKMQAAIHRQQEAKTRIDALDRELRAAELILSTSWAQVNTAVARQAVADLDRSLQELQTTPEAAELSARLQTAAAELAEAEAQWTQAHRDESVTANQQDSARKELESLRQIPEAEVEDAVARELETRLTDATRRIHAGNVDERSNMLREELDSEIAGFDSTLSRANTQITSTLSSYLQKWPAEQADLLPQPEYLGEALNRLGALRGDRLAEFTSKFLGLMNDMSTRNLGQIARALRNARREIEERIDPINRSLERSEFNTDRFLHIQVRDRRGEVVQEFQRDLDDAISGGLSTNDEKQAFARYQVIARIIRRVGSKDSADIRWRNLVLDTRRHVSFIGLERDKEGRTINTYVDSTSLSGGQAQKLVFFCLAAALRYQLAEPGAQYPTFATVILDEAFDRADPAFTRQTMDVFASFGFHMVLATPLKLIQTLGSYVGATIVVSYREAPDEQGEIRGTSRLSRIEAV